MSSSGSTYNSPTGSNTSPDQLEANVLNNLVRVGSLINAELEFANRRITRSVCRENSLVQRHVSYFERKSLSNLTTASADFLQEIPLYQPGSQGRNTLSAPVTPALSESSESLVSTQSLPNADMSHEEQQALERVGTGEEGDGFDGFEPTPYWDLFVKRASVDLKLIEKRVKKLDEALSDESNVPNTLSMKRMSGEVKRHLNDIQAYKGEYHDVTMREQVPGDKMELLSDSFFCHRE